MSSNRGMIWKHFLLRPQALPAKTSARMLANGGGLWYNFFMKRNTVYEDREIKRQKGLEKHSIVCPHCGKPALDHMTECPHCKGKLTPRGYVPPDEKKLKIIKIISYSVGTVVAIGLIIYLIFFR